MVLDENYTLTGDKYNWVLSYKSDVKINENGKEYFTADAWYFPTIEDAIKKYLNECLKPNDVAMDLINLINKLCRRLVDQAKKELA